MLVSSNSTLRSHFTHPHCEAFKTVSEPRQQSMGRDRSVFLYNPDYLCEQFAGLVIQRGLPFNYFDHEQPRRVFENTMQPKYNHVSRFTLKLDAMKLWSTAKQVIIDGFLNLNARVNIRTDVWFAHHGLPGSYLCVTARLIDHSTWQTMKRIIEFEDFSVPHTGSRLAGMLRNTFIAFNLEEKDLSITLDNASNSTNTIGKRKLKYDPPMERRGDCQPFDVENWIIVESICPLLEVFNNATKFLSGVYYPTSPLILIELISTDLEFLDDVHATRAKQWFNESLAGLYNLYYMKYGNPTTQSTSEGSSSKKSNELMFSVLSRMTIDVLSVQATSVAFEFAFSTTGRVLSIRRTKLTPSSLKMCMCLKDHLDAQERKQDKSTLENALDFEDEVLGEVQENEATSLSDEEIALDAASQGTVASSSGGEEPEFDYDLTNYDD
nr:zinc finger BED domain-containing protein RICESLEEPER 2-like [Tanacetum cinerariifolium]